MGARAENARLFVPDPIASKGSVKPRVIAALAVVLCACSSSDFHPYVGQQQKWPTSPGTFVDSQYNVPVYYGYPPRPYTVVGMMDTFSILDGPAFCLNVPASSVLL